MHPREPAGVVTRSTAWEAAIRGLLGAMAMAFALGAAVAAGEALRVHLGLGGLALQLARGGLCSALAFLLIALLRLKVDRQPVAGLGLPGWRESVRTFGLGVLLTALAAVITFGVGGVLGWVRFGELAWPALLSFLGTNTAMAFLYEAFPEEFTLRGYTYGSLRSAWSRGAACLGTTALFLLVPGLSSLFAAGLAMALDVPAPAVALVPAGEDPVAYFVLLAVFGVTLVIARIVTGSLWASIAVHLTVLAVNRLILARGTGWSIELASADALVLVPVYLLLTAGLFALLGRWQGRARSRPQNASRQDLAGGTP